MPQTWIIDLINNRLWKRFLHQIEIKLDQNA